MEGYLYHGSGDAHLIDHLSADSENGLPVDIHCLFFTRSYRQAKNYGEYVYKVDMSEFDGSDYFESSDADDDVLAEILAENGITDFDLAREAVVDEEYDADAWAAACGMDDVNNAAWFAQSLRVELARRQSFKLLDFNDECGSIGVIREFVHLLPTEICPECGEEVSECVC